jgi:hypothetical protein
MIPSSRLITSAERYQFLATAAKSACVDAVDQRQLHRHRWRLGKNPQYREVIEDERRAGAEHIAGIQAEQEKHNEGH